jgi:hypothetical protein
MQGQSQRLLSLTYPKLGTTAYSKPPTASWPPKDLRNKSYVTKLRFYFEQTLIFNSLILPKKALTRMLLSAVQFCSAEKIALRVSSASRFCRSQVKAETPSRIRILPLVFYPKSFSSRISDSPLLYSLCCSKLISR